MTRILIVLFALLAALFVWARIIAVDVSMSPAYSQSANLRESVNNICRDCRSKGNIPACSYICNLNAMNVAADIEDLTGVYKLKYHGTQDFMRWILALECGANGTVTGFSTVRKGHRYENYDVSGLYVGSSTILLLLSTTDDTSEPAAPPSLLDERQTHTLQTSADPGAVGLKLVVSTGDILRGSTTGYTYLDDVSPIEVAFQKTNDPITSEYFTRPRSDS